MSVWPSVVPAVKWLVSNACVKTAVGDCMSVLGCNRPIPKEGSERNIVFQGAIE